MSDLPPTPRPPDDPPDAPDAPDSQELLDVLETIVRRACGSQVVGLYDTFFFDHTLPAFEALARDGRFRILWSGTSQGLERRIGCFLVDAPAGEPAVAIAEHLASLDPHQDPDLEAVALAAAADFRTRPPQAASAAASAALAKSQRLLGLLVEPADGTARDDAVEHEQALLDVIEDLVRDACQTPFEGLYDTLHGGAVLQAVEALVEADRFAIVWSEDEPGRGTRHMGFFRDDDVDEDELTSQAQMLATLRPRLAALADGQDDETAMLVDLIEDFVRETCDSPFVGLYDTFRGGAALQAFMVLADDERFEILWSEDDPDRGDRYIGYFVDDDVDEDELVSMTRMLSGLTPRADEPESPWDDEDDEDEDDQDTNPELTATVRQFLAVRDAQHARLVGYAQAALQGLLATGLNSHPSKDARHAEVAREAWAHAHAMLRLDPDYGSAPGPDAGS